MKNLLDAAPSFYYKRLSKGISDRKSSIHIVLYEDFLETYWIWKIKEYWLGKSISLKGKSNIQQNNLTSEYSSTFVNWNYMLLLLMYMAKWHKHTNMNARSQPYAHSKWGDMGYLGFLSIVYFRNLRKLKMHVSKLHISPLVMLETNGKQICQNIASTFCLV